MSGRRGSRRRSELAGLILKIPSATVLAISAAIAVAGSVSPVLAAPDFSLPPLMRPGSVETVQMATTGGPRFSLPPRLRPGTSKGGSSGQSQTTGTAGVEITASGPTGTLCADRAIQGQRLAPIRGTLAGCRVDEPVRVSRIAGVRLNPPAVISCRAAKAAKSWIQDDVTPAFGRLGGGLVQAEVSQSYACPSQGFVSGDREAAHGSGDALDIRAFTLANGISVEVAKAWNDPIAGQIVRQVHKDACREFKGVLGPDAGGNTRDHIHLDVAAGRGVCR